MFRFINMAIREANADSCKMSSQMQIIPVIDLCDSRVVHAVRGQRHRYRPVESQIATSCQPADVAAAFLALGCRYVYVADLDAIGGSQPNTRAIDEIATSGLHVWLDAGFSEAHQVRSFGGDQGFHGDIVVGLETLASVDALEGMLSVIGSDRLVFSLDHRGGTPITQIKAWQQATIAQIANEAAACGVQRFIDLDLSRVGSHTGPQGRGLAAELRDVCEDAFVAIGGGVRSIDDIHMLAEQGYNAVLVATALHDGSISADDIQPFIGNVAT
jgi:HisA/HisF family protein